METSKCYTDEMHVVIKIDESSEEAKVDALIHKVKELLVDLKGWKENLPARPSNGAYNNDAGFMAWNFSPTLSLENIQNGKIE